MEQSTEHMFLAAYDQYSNAIFRFCYAQTGDREAALDLTQDAFSRTWKHLAGGGRVEQLRPFLYRTARNAMIDRYRRHRTVSLDTLTEQGFDAADETSTSPLVSAQASQVIRLAAQLEPKYREAVLLRYAEDMAPREIAQITGESENVISVRIHRGMQRLRTLMGIEHD